MVHISLERERERERERETTQCTCLLFVTPKCDWRQPFQAATWTWTWNMSVYMKMMVAFSALLFLLLTEPGTNECGQICSFLAVITFMDFASWFFF